LKKKKLPHLIFKALFMQLEAKSCE